MNFIDLQKVKGIGICWCNRRIHLHFQLHPTPQLCHCGVIFNGRRLEMISNQGHYVNLSTRKRDGSFVNTPVWFAQEGETDNYYVYSLRKAGKVKRIRNFPDVRVATCNFSGKLKGDWIDARADLIDESENVKIAYSLLRGKYGIRFRIGNFFSWINGNYYRRQIIRFSIKRAS